MRKGTVVNVVLISIGGLDFHANVCIIAEKEENGTLLYYFRVGD